VVEHHQSPISIEKNLQSSLQKKSPIPISQSRHQPSPPSIGSVAISSNCGGHVRQYRHPLQSRPLYQAPPRILPPNRARPRNPPPDRAPPRIIPKQRRRRKKAKEGGAIHDRGCGR
jgi:hypothetical protein